MTSFATKKYQGIEKFWVGYSIVTTTLFVVFAIKFIPQNWLASMDGYYYGLIIKNFLYSYEFSARDGESPLNYPPHFFYLVALFGRMLGVYDLGYLQFFSFFLVCIGVPIGTYALLVPAWGRLRAFGGSVLAVSFSIFAAISDVHIWQKPHAIASLLIFPAVVVWSAGLEQANLSRRLRAIAGLVAGFSFGAYTPTAILAVGGIGCVFLFALTLKLFKHSRFSFAKILDPYFVLPAAFASAPYIFSLVKSMTSTSQSIGIEVWFEAKHYEWEFVNYGVWSAPYWFSFISAVLFMIIAMSGRKNQYQCIFLSSSIISGIIIYSLFVYLYFNNNIHTTAPFKYYIPIPFIGGMIMGSLYPDILIFLNNLIRKYSKRTSPRGENCFFGGGFSLVVLVSIFTEWHMMSNIGLSRARNNNLSEVSSAIESIKRNCRIERYIADGEYRFLEYYVRGRFNSHLIFNQSYASAHEDLIARARRLREAIAGGASQFARALSADRIDVIVLGQPSDGVYRIEFMANDFTRVPPMIGVREVVDIPERLVGALTQSGELARMVAPAQVFVVAQRLSVTSTAARCGIVAPPRNLDKPDL